MLESVAILRVATVFLTKWYYFYKIKSKFLNSQFGSNTSQEITASPVNANFENSLRQYKNIFSDSVAYSATLSFFLKSLYFHTGYGDLISYICKEGWWLISNVSNFDSLKKVINFIIDYVSIYLSVHLAE